MRLSTPRRKNRTTLTVEKLETRILMTAAPELFVGGVYKQLLDRPADQAGLQFWTGWLENGASQLQIVRDIEQSTEARQVGVRQLYTDLLGRVADAGGLQFYAAQLEAGAS